MKGNTSKSSSGTLVSINLTSNPEKQTKIQKKLHFEVILT